MKVVLVGGGRMGLPLACLLADNGADVTVCDISQSLVEQINAGDAPYEEPGLDSYLSRTVKAERLRATTKTTEAVSAAGVVIVIVPAWLTDGKDIDYSILKSVAEDVGKGMTADTLVSFETTVAVGGTRSQLVPILEESSGLSAGKDFQVCFSPERVKANHVFARLQKVPKVIGGYDDNSAEKAVQFYSKYLGAPITNVHTLEAAELVKLAGMLYRDVNIALANELAALSEIAGVDFSLVREASNGNGEANLLIPGIGVGGHCTPVYPYFIISDAMRRGVPQRLSTIAREINDEQPGRSAERLNNEWKSLKGKKVHILGLGFRPDVKVATFSPAFAIRHALLEHGATVTIEDPFYTSDELRDAGFEPAKVGEDKLDAVVLNTAHSEFGKPDFEIWRASGIEALLDGRNLWDPRAVSQAGILYLGIGRDKALDGA